MQGPEDLDSVRPQLQNHGLPQDQPRYQRGSQPRKCSVVGTSPPLLVPSRARLVQLATFLPAPSPRPEELLQRVRSCGGLDSAIYCCRRCCLTLFCRCLLPEKSRGVSACFFYMPLPAAVVKRYNSFFGDSPCFPDTADRVRARAVIRSTLYCLDRSRTSVPSPRSCPSMPRPWPPRSSRRSRPRRSPTRLRSPRWARGRFERRARQEKRVERGRKGKGTEMNGGEGEGAREGTG